MQNVLAFVGGCSQDRCYAPPREVLLRTHLSDDAAKRLVLGTQLQKTSDHMDAIAIRNANKENGAGSFGAMTADAMSEMNRPAPM